MSDSIEKLRELSVRISSLEYAKNDFGIDSCVIDKAVEQIESLTKQLEEAKEIIAHQLGLEKNLLEFRDRLLDDIDQWRKLCDSQKIEIAALQPQWKPIKEARNGIEKGEWYWICVKDGGMCVGYLELGDEGTDNLIFGVEDMLSYESNELTHYAPYIEPKAPEE